MTDTKHTPGPWGHTKHKRTVLVTDAHGNFIAAVKPVSKFGIAGTDEGNTHLIAAAPELLKALEETVNQLATLQIDKRTQYGWSNERTNMVSASLLQARAAIAKAKGETQ